MPGTNTKNFAMSLFLVAAIVCFTFGLFAIPDKNLTNTILAEETSSTSAARQAIWEVKSAICMLDAIVSVREDNISANSKVIQNFSRRYHNKHQQSMFFVLLMLFICMPAFLLLRFLHNIAKAIKTGMPVLALSLGGNSPPVIRT